jgi:hypothetical protein
MAYNHRIRPFTTGELAYVEVLTKNVCAMFNISEEQIKSYRRYGNYVNARRCLFYLLKTKTEFSLTKIGQVLNPVHYKDVPNKKGIYTPAQAGEAYLTDHSSVSITIKKAEFMLDPTNFKYLDDSGRAFKKRTEKLAEKTWEYTDNTGPLFIGRLCHVNGDPGVVTRIYNNRIRVLFQNEEEADYPKHLLNTL